MGAIFPLNKLFARLFTNRRERAFRSSYNQFKLLSASDQRFRLDTKDLYPCLDDATGATNFDPHYVYHTAWAARRIKQHAPNSHVDLSSFLYFSTLLSAFIPVRFFDYRPANVQLSGLTAERADLNKLQFASDSIESLS